MVTGATDVNTDPHGYIRAMDQVMVLASSSDPYMTMALDGKQTNYLSHFFTTPPSSDLPLSLELESFCFSISHFSTMYLLTIMEPTKGVGDSWLISSCPKNRDEYHIITVIDTKKDFDEIQHGFLMKFLEREHISI